MCGDEYLRIAEQESGDFAGYLASSTNKTRIQGFLRQQKVSTPIYVIGVQCAHKQIFRDTLGGQYKLLCGKDKSISSEDIAEACLYNERIARESSELEIAAIWRLVATAWKEDPTTSSLAAILLSKVVAQLR